MIPPAKPGQRTVAFIEHKLNLESGGGSNFTLHHMASALAAAGYRVYVITLVPEMNHASRDVPYTIIEHKLADSYLAIPQRLTLVRLLFKWQRNVDVFQIEAPSLMTSGALYRLLGGRVPVISRLHTYSWFCSNLGRMDGKCFRKCSLVARLHHREESLVRKLLLAPVRIGYDILSRLVANRIDKFISLSQPSADIEAVRGLDSDRLIVIPPIVDNPPSPAPATHDAGDPLRLLYIGRLAQEKGVDVLVRAVAGLDFPVRVDVVGDGPELGMLRKLAARLGAADSLQFHGWQDQEKVRGFYSSTDVFVHPGRWPEPAGRTVMDALGWGLPVIVSNVGGPPWIANGAGLTFEPGDHEDLRRKIETIRRDPALARRLAGAATSRSRDFRRELVINKLTSLYAEIAPLPEEERETAMTAAGGRGGRA